MSDTILKGRERESLLNVANDLFDVFANAAGVGLAAVWLVAVGRRSKSQSR